MRISPITTAPRSTADRTRVADVLGSDHPLARLAGARDTVALDLVAVGIVLVGATAGLLAGSAWALPVAAAASAVLGGLAIVLLGLGRRMRRAAIELILNGREALPVALVQRERRRLLSARTRAGLARALESMVRVARSRIDPFNRPIFDVAVIAGLADELLRVAAMLRDPPRLARGVALLERLLSDGLSPAYGSDAEALREELHRVRFVLRV